jgi:hypothetical protein
MRRIWACALVLALLLSLLSGCAAAGTGSAASAAASPAASGSASAGEAEGSLGEGVSIADEQVALTAAPAVPTTLKPMASGTLVKKNDKAAVDYSNTAEGYVMVRYSAATSKKLKAQVTGASANTYTYDLPAGEAWTTFPLSDGSGSYKVNVYENISGTRYSTVLSATFTAALKDEFLPFLYPNQYVNYENAPKTVAKAAELTASLTDNLAKVKAVYGYVVKTLSYDKQKAATVQSGYLPVLDTVLATKKGICFDYAALMSGMLRSQGVPCKLVVGYAGTAYHSWINVWSGESGWVNGAIYFDGTSWKLMDPTFASTGKQSKSIMQYIGDGSHYTAKYLY